MLCNEAMTGSFLFGSAARAHSVFQKSVKHRRWPWCADAAKLHRQAL